MLPQVPTASTFRPYKQIRKVRRLLDRDFHCWNMILFYLDVYGLIGYHQRRLYCSIIITCSTSLLKKKFCNFAVMHNFITQNYFLCIILHRIRVLILSKRSKKTNVKHLIYTTLNDDVIQWSGCSTCLDQSLFTIFSCFYYVCIVVCKIRAISLAFFPFYVFIFFYFLQSSNKQISSRQIF